MALNNAVVRVYNDLTSLCNSASRLFVEKYEQAMTERGIFRIALAGGYAPEALYQRIASDDVCAQIDWSKVHVFWTNECHLPPYHEKSKFRMARQALLAKIKLPPENMHRILGELPSVEKAAEDYQKVIREDFEIGPGEFPNFDLILLGMGEDGHVASFFPGAAALVEKDRAVIPLWVDSLKEHRICLTIPSINSSRAVWFIVAGDIKAGMVKQVFEGEEEISLPARRIKPVKGELVWFLDKPAASNLDPQINELVYMNE